MSEIVTPPKYGSSCQECEAKLSADGKGLDYPDNGPVFDIVIGRPSANNRLVITLCALHVRELAAKCHAIEATP